MEDFNIGDRVMVTTDIDPTSYGKEYLYGDLFEGSTGTVSEITHDFVNNMEMLIISNLNHHHPELKFEFYSSMVTKIDKTSQLSKNDDNTCRHIWEKTGISPISAEIWYNCKICNVPKENAL